MYATKCFAHLILFYMYIFLLLLLLSVLCRYCCCDHVIFSKGLIKWGFVPVAGVLDCVGGRSFRDGQRGCGRESGGNRCCCGLFKWWRSTRKKIWSPWQKKTGKRISCFIVLKIDNEKMDGCCIFILYSKSRKALCLYIFVKLKV